MQAAFKLYTQLHVQLPLLIFRSRFVLLLLQKNSSTIRRPQILQRLSMVTGRICKDSLKYVLLKPVK